MAHLLLLVLLLGFASLAEASVVISEVLADPPSGLAGDANQDGVRDTYQDEFIELYNAGSAPVDISGWRLGDSSPSSDSFFQFPAAAVIEPGAYVVLFGGGNPTGFTVSVYIDDGKIGGNGLTGKGEDIHLIDDTGDTVSVISHTPWPSKQSLVRHPPDGDELVPHKTASTIKALFSPGSNHIIPKPDYPLFISEVLADPPTGEAGDANRDGRRDTYEDEFIELYNAGSEPISLAGWKLGDSTAPKNSFQFPADAVIESGSYVVLFGGGNPTGFTGPVYIDDGKIGNGLTGKGEKVLLIDNNGHEIAVVDHTPWPSKQSLVRNPSDGDMLVPHKTASTVKALFSPGHTHIIPKPDYPLFISEVLADPPTGEAGDANRDGRRDTYEDEFIELYNAGDAPISLSGWRLGDSTSPATFFQFPADAVIAPHSYVVLFGGGKPTGFTGPVYIDDGKIGNGLTGKGEKVLLIDNNGHEIDVILHDKWPSKQSLVRQPSDGGAWVPHKTASTVKALFSPGHTHIIPKPDYPLFISEVLADPPSGLAGDANRDGQRDGYEDDFIELYNAGSNPISLAGWRLGDSTSPATFFQFPADAVIAPHSYVVLFGGGNPSGFTVPVYIDDGKIGNGLTSKGEDIRLIDKNGHEIDVVSHDDWPKDQSIVRTPPNGGPFVPHKTASPTQAPFSPGHAPTSRPILTYPLVISEVLADPPEGPTGDANRDGQYDPHEDEFIELYNAGSVLISLAGWRLGDAGSLSNYFRFPAKAVIAPRSYVVLFGGGKPLGFTIPVYTDDGTIGDGLANAGEAIYLIDNHGYEAASLLHATWPNAQSLVRTPPDSGVLVPHKTASPHEAPFSVGHAPEARPMLTYPLSISEVLADPPERRVGDANRDGRRDPHEDEFIELYNDGPVPVSLAGWRLGDAGSLSGYFHFPPDAVIAPRSYIVLFGGGSPSDFSVPVYTDDGTIGDGITDSGESIHLINDHGDEVAFLSHATWPDDQSLVRTPPDDGALVPHKTVSPVEAPFSPGIAPKKQTRADLPKPPPRPTYSLFISEVLADPPDDANQDGHYDPYEDEFIELYNASTDTISLASWQLGDSASLRDYFRFPPGAFIAPHSYVVLFGGGSPAGFAIPVYTDDGKIGDGLTNAGEAIYLIDKTGYLVARVSQASWPDDQSIVRTPPDGDAFVPHQTASPTQAPFSPGRAIEAPSDSAAKVPAMGSASSLQVWPNPFNATTHLVFRLHQAAAVHVTIYNVHGQRVRTLVNAPLHAGAHQMQWDGRDERGHSAATGLYLARFRIEHSPPRYAKLVLLH